MASILSRPQCVKVMHKPLQFCMECRPVLERVISAPGCIYIHFQSSIPLWVRWERCKYANISCTDRCLQAEKRTYSYHVTYEIDRLQVISGKVSIPGPTWTGSFFIHSSCFTIFHAKSRLMQAGFKIRATHIFRSLIGLIIWQLSSRCQTLV